MAEGLLLVVVGIVGLLLLLGVVVWGVFWVLDRIPVRRGDRAAAALSRQLSRGEITPDAYRTAIDAIEGRAGPDREA
jgi:uncharacterized membrane protein